MLSESLGVLQIWYTISGVRATATSTSAVSPGARMPSVGWRRTQGLQTSSSSFLGTKSHSAITDPVLRSSSLALTFSCA